MASIFISNWIKHTDKKIQYWFLNYHAAHPMFNITPLPALPIINSNVLNHNLTSCCPSPNFPAISFAHFPEPYYGNPDDSIEKLAVVLFYNPGPTDINQLIGNMAVGSFHNKYLINEKSYYNLSSNLDFCNNTIDRFWNQKNLQLLRLFQCMEFKKNELKPYFMDLIPWHSDKFKGLNLTRFVLPNNLLEFKNNVILPAIFNANNSAATIYLNKLNSNKNKIVLFAVGAKYSTENYLSSIGFIDFTAHVPANHHHIIAGGNMVAGASSKIKIWKINADELISDSENLKEIKEKEIFIINMWTPNVGMNIPNNICETINHIFNSI